MSWALRLAFLGSAVLHVVAMAVLHGPSPIPLSVPVLVSLRQQADPGGAPAPGGRPVPSARRGRTSVPAKVPTAAIPIADAPRPAIPTPTTSASSQAASAVASNAPAPLEPPRYAAAYLANPPPPYPPAAKRRGIEGTAWIDARVGTGGEAHEVKLATSAGNAALDEAAIAAVQSWRFVPARRGSEAVEAWVRIPVVFRLN